MKDSLLSKIILSFWSWLISTITDYEDDISYGLKLEQQYQELKKDLIND
jgi:hypothetical protein